MAQVEDIIRQKTQNFLVKYSQSTDKSVTTPLALMVVSSWSVKLLND